MNIPPEFRPVDPAVRRRLSEPATRPAAPPAQAAASSAASGADQAVLSRGAGFDEASVGRFVAILKDMNPLDLHRVEDLRQRISDGSYSTDPEELADLLMGGDTRPEGPERRRG